MRTITSKRRAIVYFEKGTKVETRRSSGGEEYQVTIPPVGFKRMRVIFADNPFITYKYEAYQWIDYANLLKHKAVLKLIIYYE